MPHPRLAVFVSALLVTGVFCPSPAFVGAADPGAAAQSPAADLQRQQVRTDMESIAERLDACREQQELSADLWADVQVYLKAIRWTLDFQPLEKEEDWKHLHDGLQHARGRLELLEAGQPDWPQRKGQVARGYISEVDGSVQPYALAIPAGYDPEVPIRLDVVLHGSMRASGDAELKFLLARNNDAPPPTADYIELFPLGRIGENAYRFEGETDIDEAIAAVCRNYRIDHDRIVLRGSSLGGVGTWQLGLRRPDRYAALGPNAGPVDTYEFANSPWPHFVRLRPLTPWQERMLPLTDAINYAANAGMVPVVAVMGNQDHYYSSHLLIQKAFAEEGVPFNGFTDYGAGHGVSAEARQVQLALLSKYAAQPRDPVPRDIRFVTWTLKFSRCFWIEVLGLEEHYRRAEIVAQRAEDGSISVNRLENITQFAIELPADRKAGATITVLGTEVALPDEDLDVSRTVVIRQHDGRWVYAGDRREFPMTGKRPGLQGPIDDAFSRPFLCVRGTDVPMCAEAGAWADASLNRFADEWRRHYRGDLPVKDDVDVTAEDLQRCNLILFGDPGSNPWISKVLPQLPIRWSKGAIEIGDRRFDAATHGIQLICPNPLPGAEDRYVVLNSGHTYHDEELRFSYMVFPRLGDWAVVRLGDNSNARAPAVAETVIESGLFDEAWNQPVFVEDSQPRRASDR